MYTYSSLPAPIRLLPLSVLIFVMLLGVLAAQLVLSSLPPVVRLAPPAAPKVDAPAAPIPAPEPELSGVFTPEVQHWKTDILRWAKDYQLDPNLVATVMQIESCGNPAAVSKSGAQGLFQVMPFHFSDGEAMLDPDTNAKRGLAYLADGLSLSGNQPALALAGYNGGHSQIGKLWSAWPEETQRYYYWGSGIMADVQAKTESSGRLAEWLTAGGASLCAKAHQALQMP